MASKLSTCAWQSTHPCHARRVEDLQAHVGQVREDFNQKIDSLTMSGRPVPESMRLLPYEGVRKPEDANRCVTLSISTCRVWQFHTLLLGGQERELLTSCLLAADMLY